MGDNLKIRKLRLDLMNDLNSSALPIEVKRNILELLLVEVNKLADDMVQKEIEEEKSKESEEQE